MDDVAYIRFASVYEDFQRVDDFATPSSRSSARAPSAPQNRQERQDRIAFRGRHRTRIVRAADTLVRHHRKETGCPGLASIYLAISGSCKCATSRNGETYIKPKKLVANTSSLES